jgi:hypothetical protein
MAKLPNRSDAQVSPRKISEYLLNRSHPVGGPKAAFFELFGFKLDTARELEHALKAHAYNCDVIKIVDNRFGHKYTLEGPLTTPSGRSPSVVTVWIVRAGGTIPEFVTAFPGKEEAKS